MPPPDDRLSAAAASLVAWYGRSARDLPWRRRRDAYGVLVSEIMLQQTRVETVAPRFEEFVARFPDLASLAAADEQDVLAAWSGLGYYRRARNLHAAARAVRDLHDGELPSEGEALRSLPGLGEYTAAAVAAIAWDHPVLAIDGNIERVMCRLLGITDDPRRAATRRTLRQAAAPWLATHAPSVLNQALMDLGARVCLPRAPRCQECPCAKWCVALAGGLTAEIPPSRRQAVADVLEAAAVIESDGRFLMFRGQRPGTLRDMWEFPTLDSRMRQPVVRDSAPGDLAAELAAHLGGLGVDAGALRRIGEIRHGITTRRIRCTVYRGHGASGEPDLQSPAAPEQHGWFTAAQLAGLPLAASSRKILALPGLRAEERAATF